MSTHEKNGAEAPPAEGTPVTNELLHIAPSPEAPAPSAPKVSPETIFTGEILRKVRESQRLTLKELSQRTRISVASLAALESERYEDLPNARVYVRGFVRALAVEIGLDRDQVSRTYVPRWEAWFLAHGGR